MSCRRVVLIVVLLSGVRGSTVSARTPEFQQNASIAASTLVASADPVPAASSSVTTPSSSTKSEVLAVRPVRPAQAADAPLKPFSKFAISTKSSTLGAGFQMATPLTRSINLRGGANFFSFGYGTSADGANYAGSIALRDGQVSVDFFPFHKHSFHVSPGLVIFKGGISATQDVPGGNNFDLGSQTFQSSPSDPIHGTASVNFSRSLMPSLTVGWGNMITREGKHWSIPFEIGAAYMGASTVQLNLSGSACITYGCMSTSDPSIHQSVIDEQSVLNESAKKYQIYPIITSGVSYRF